MALDRFAAKGNEAYFISGSCGWTDTTIAQCGRFYPRSAKTASDKLAFYSRQFPIVEIDTSTYAIPRKDQLAEWLKAVPPGFLFAIKIFGPFASGSIKPEQVPRDLRGLLPLVEPEPESLRLSTLPAPLLDALWQRFNEAAAMLHARAALACVVFQFHASFTPTAETIAYVADCRRRLGREYHMAVEFRSRAWYSQGAAVAMLPEGQYHGITAAADGSLSSGSPPVQPPPPPPSQPHASAGTSVLSATSHRTQRDATHYFMRRCGIINIPSDDLSIEMPPHEPLQPAYADGRLLIDDAVTSPAMAYCRLHRRRGSDRLLRGDEVAEWAGRMHRIAATAGGWRATAAVAAAVAPVMVATQRLADPASSGAVQAPANAHAPASAPTSAPAADDEEPACIPGGSSASGAYTGRIDAPPAAARLPRQPEASSSNSGSSGGGSASSSASSCAAAAEASEYHPWYFTRLRGPIAFMIGTDWEDQPVINLRALSGALETTAALLSSSAGAGALPRAVPYPWKEEMRAYDSKRGLNGMFAKQLAASSASAATAAASGSSPPAPATSPARVAGSSGSGGSGNGSASSGEADKPSSQTYDGAAASQGSVGSSAAALAPPAPPAAAPAVAASTTAVVAKEQPQLTGVKRSRPEGTDGSDDGDDGDDDVVVIMAPGAAASGSKTGNGSSSSSSIGSIGSSSSRLAAAAPSPAAKAARTASQPSPAGKGKATASNSGSSSASPGRGLLAFFQPKK